MALLSTGGALGIAVEVSALLGLENVNASVISIPFLQPLDSTALNALIDRIPLLVTIEEHSLYGGLRTAVIESLQAALKPGVELYSFGLVPAWVDSWNQPADSHTFACHTLTPQLIAEKILELRAIK